MVKQPKVTCPKATGLFSILGKKWVLFILHAMYSGAHTFTEIRKSVGEANTKILTDRLGELVESELIAKCPTEGSYGLTENGKKLTKKLLSLADWWGTEKK